MRLIDADMVEIGFKELCQSPYLKKDINAKHGAETLMDLCVRTNSRISNTIAPESLPIVRQLREQLKEKEIEINFLRTAAGLKNLFQKNTMRGKWIKQKCQGDYGVCSLCGCRIPWIPKNYNFCPSCGADMRNQTETDNQGV